jgi:hypothetical protein
MLPNAKLDWAIFFVSSSPVKFSRAFLVVDGKLRKVGDLVLFEGVIISVG